VKDTKRLSSERASAPSRVRSEAPQKRWQRTPSGSATGYVATRAPAVLSTSRCVRQPFELGVHVVTSPQGQMPRKRLQPQLVMHVCV